LDGGRAAAFRSIRRGPEPSRISLFRFNISPELGRPAVGMDLLLDFPLVVIT